MTEDGPMEVSEAITMRAQMMWKRRNERDGSKQKIQIRISFISPMAASVKPEEYIHTLDKHLQMADISYHEWKYILVDNLITDLQKIDSELSAWKASTVKACECEASPTENNRDL